jgi:ubiquinone/menaquinone biosynthesis C-methylase UbiE
MATFSPEVTRRFEWLTSPASLESLLFDLLPETPSALLHVGSGSSILAESLLENSKFQKVQRIVNVDIDDETLARMKSLWSNSCHTENNNNRDRLQFCRADFSQPSALPFDDASFDIVIDKSTLDCLLCSDKGSAGLICEVFRVLKPGGVYVVVSFHHIDFLRPLLEDCPGADWTMTNTVIDRQVEDLISNKQADTRRAVSLTEHATIPDSTQSRQWSERERFEPSESYRRTVNVLQCRRRGSTVPLDLSSVYEHIHAVNDQWYQKENPLMTRKRKDELYQAFETESTLLDLDTSYSVLFTDAEKEHLTFELFLEDWSAFVEAKGVPSDFLSFATALAFLEEMQ